MSKKVILFVRRRADLTHEQFKARYEQGHIPLVRRLMPQIGKYVRNYLSALPGQPEPEFDCVTEFWFDSQADVDACLASYGGENGAILARDEAEFMDRGSMQSFVVDEAAGP